MISGPEVITCDNTQFTHSHSDPDRSGVLLSVPFFGPDDQLKGMVTAIVLSSALRGLLPPEDFALINLGYDYTSRPSIAGLERASADWIQNGAPNPNLIYSKVVPLDVADVKSPWKLWVGFPDTKFSNGPEAKSVRLFELNGYIVTLVLMLAGCLWLSLSRRNYELAKAAGVVLEKRVEERTAEIRHLASHDTLTGLPNRALLYEEIEGALRRSGRSQNIAVLCIDLDRFKGVNDTLGHPIGDALLRAVTERLKQCVREFDVVARLGGDEFVIVLTDLEDPEQAGVLGQRIIENISEPFEIEGHQILVGASVGIAVAPADGNNSSQLLKNADVALYKAKTDGRGMCRFFELAMDTHLQERRRLELDLRRALRDKEFELFYQPIVDAETHQISGFEALLRWNHPDRGLVMPGDFVPLAEETGIIIPIGQWVLSRACEDAARWPKDVQIAVNLSPIQFTNNNLISSVVGALRDSGLHPGRLQLEITESVLLTNNDATVAILHQLKDLGVRIVMDDFGTGYSSLSYLRTFPFDKIKIDRSFIHDLVGNNDCIAIVRAIASLGKSLGMVTTAEGVETGAEIGLVRELGCREAQGYLFGRPLPVGSVAALLQGKLTAVA
jgi:diguanylate cyclase (GGDEF)-like protein